MVESDLVKKRKRKKITAICGLVSASGIAVLAIVAFLGQYVGSFTVAVNKTGKVEISLYDNKALQNPTTFIKIGDIPQMGIFTSSKITPDSEIDNADNSFLYGAKYDSEGKPKFLYFFKYTFYVKNTGEEVVHYTFNLNVTENIKPSNVNYDLLDLSRVRFYDNVDESAHKYVTYAKEGGKTRYDEEGNPTTKKPIAGEIGTKEYCGYAEPYVSNTTLITKEVDAFAPGEIKRYTIVLWLEGEDELATGLQPENCSLKLGVDISGYES